MGASLLRGCSVHNNLLVIAVGLYIEPVWMSLTQFNRSYVTIDKFKRIGKGGINPNRLRQCSCKFYLFQLFVRGTGTTGISSATYGHSCYNEIGRASCRTRDYYA